MATTPHALTSPATSAKFCESPGTPPASQKGAKYCAFSEPTTAAGRVIEHIIALDDAKALREAQRARRDMENALALVRGFLAIGPDPRALTLLARDAAEFMARVEGR